MNRPRAIRHVLTIVTTALLLAGGALGQSPASASAPAQPGKAPTAGVSTHFHLRTALPGVRFQSERQLSNGDYAATWQIGRETVKVAAPTGSTVTVVAPTAKSSGVAVALPAPKVKPTGMSRDSLKPGGAVVPDALAVGFTPAQATAMVRKAQHTVHPMYNVGDIMATPCASVSGDSGRAWGRACDTQKFLQDHGGGNWIVGDEIVGSGNDCCVSGSANLTALTSWISYGANNNIFNWAPNATISVGSCTSYTASLGYNGSGVSATTNICDQLSPYDANTGTQFGSTWGTCDWQGNTEGNASTDIDNNPSNASAGVTLHVSISWVAPNLWGGC